MFENLIILSYSTLSKITEYKFINFKIFLEPINFALLFKSDFDGSLRTAEV